MSQRNLLVISLLLGVFPFVPAFACENLDDDFDYDDEGMYGLSSDVCSKSDCRPYEAEDRTGTSGCKKSTKHKGYSGSGFVDFGGNGTWIEWNNVAAPIAGEYTLTFRYGNGSGGDRRSSIIVGGKKSGDVSFAKTGSWDAWKTTSFKVFLNKGNNAIRVQANTGSGGPNLDNMLVVGRGLGGTDGGGGDSGDGGEGGGQGVVLQENTTGFCAADGDVEKNHSGYSGAGFVNVDNFKGSGIEWSIDGGSGEYSFRWRYANGKNGRPARLLVGGKEVAANIDFDSTGSWENWKEVGAKVVLSVQVKRVRLEAITENGLANIDSMEITGPEVQAVGCQQDPETETEIETKLVGFATQNGGTTGGSGGRTVTVTNAQDFLGAIADDDRLVIKVNGKISISGMHKVSSNKTIVGVGKNGVISGGGLNISNVSNVIIQNLLFSGSNDDAINVQYSKNVWIDHCDLTDAYDGLVDIKRGSDFITVSWNHFSNHNKTCLLGHSDSNGSEDIGHLRVTYHHNWFDHTSSRHPRVRFSELTHVYNNYYDSNGSYGVASTENAEVLVEGNYFYDVDRPTLIGYGSSGSGDLVEKNNIFKSSGSPETRHSVPDPPYRYQLDNASLIPSIVKNGAGRNGFK